MAKSTNVIELDNHTKGLNVDETFARAQRQSATDVVIVTYHKEDDQATIFTSVMDDRDAFWYLSKAARRMLDVG